MKQGMAKPERRKSESVLKSRADDCELWKLVPGKSGAWGKNQPQGQKLGLWCLRTKDVCQRSLVVIFK